MSCPASLFEHRQKLLALAASAYVLFLILSHWQLPQVHVWIIAAVFSGIMNITYVAEAFWRRVELTKEAAIALVLIVASVLGVFLHPVFVIAAIFGHGVWDVAKHYGAGVPFFSWYCLSCFVIDLIYGSVLFMYWLG